MKEQTFLTATCRMKEYNAPMVERIDAHVERGFQMSSSEPDDPTALTRYNLVEGQENKFI